MSSPEALVRAGNITLALDTNAMYGATGRLLKLCNRVNRLNMPPRSLNLRLGVPAPVHMEMLLDIRHKRIQGGLPYDAAEVDRGMRDKGLHVLAFEARHAEEAAELIAGTFTDPPAWREAKRLRCVHCLGAQDSPALQKAGRRCSATIDWLIAAQATQERWVLVTDDKGVEFSKVSLKMRLEALEHLLEELLAASPQGPGTAGS